MTDKKRTFLLGAGFSKAVADGPLMSEIWNYIEEAYENEKNRKVSITGKSLRIDWFVELDNFLKKLETEATSRFSNLKFDEIQAGIRQNLEYLFTLIDLHLSGPKVRFKKKGVDISPYPFIPLPFTGRDELKNMKGHLLDFLYIILVNLKGDDLVNKFAKIINEKDQIITFNYDLVLEKELWQRNIWSPLNGYVGIDQFSEKNDQEKLRKADRISGLKIHKMHGSVSWVNPSKVDIALRDSGEHIFIELDDNENWGFHFNGLEEILEREPIKPSSKNEREYSEGYGGGYNPGWILPSFIKPFEKREFYEIWKSALRVMSNTDELVIIGYSFRPEDSSAQLLISALPDKCNITLVDPSPENIKKRLEKIGLKISNTYKSLEEYISRKV